MKLFMSLFMKNLVERSIVRRSDFLLVYILAFCSFIYIFGLATTSIVLGIGCLINFVGILCGADEE